jgi:hypothetical protein
MSSSLCRVKFTPGNPVPYDKSKISSKSRDKRGNAEDKIAWEYGAEKAPETEGCDFIDPDNGDRCEVKCGRSFSSEIKDRELTEAYYDLGKLLNTLDHGFNARFDSRILPIPMEEELKQRATFLADRSMKLSKNQLYGTAKEFGAFQVLAESGRHWESWKLLKILDKFTPSRMLLKQNNVKHLILADSSRKDGEWFLPLSTPEDVDEYVRFEGFYKGEVRFSRIKTVTKLPLISKYDWLCGLFKGSEDIASLTIAN